MKRGWYWQFRRWLRLRTRTTRQGIKVKIWVFPFDSPVARYKHYVRWSIPGLTAQFGLEFDSMERGGAVLKTITNHVSDVIDGIMAERKL